MTVATTKEAWFAQTGRVNFLCQLLWWLKITVFFDDADNSLFDASQYEFFGQSIGEEVELGGLEDDQDDSSVMRLRTDEYHLFNKDEVTC